MRFIKKALSALGLSASMLFLAAAPASAHTLDEAVRAGAGCGWTSGSYSTLHSAAVTTNGGTRYGTAYLLWSNTYQQNCVVTIKSGATHGVSTRTAAYLYLSGSGNEYYYDDGNYAHYAARAYGAGGRCVAYAGIIYGTSGTLATGGRSEYGNCG
ncbi:MULTISPECIES: hypothetical protein [unclassified Nocardiopsis]|uniref:hypothetical protein n=1 Tax=unclassified Nocardiopsis TaxID=2649073 RepID=UPI00135C2D83|nr:MULTISPECIES: hypothetical protein [unclassified Nocardiopsis]